MNVSLRKVFDAVQKGKDQAKKSIAMIVSNASIDRDEEIIQESAWIARLKHFLANPIVCWNHPLGIDLAPPDYLLGTSLQTEVVKGEGLLADMQFAVDINPLARMCWELADAGILRAVSVGAGVYDFVTCWDPEERLKELDPPNYAAMQQGLAWRTMTDCELWEISWTFAGSNREALNRALKDGTVSKNTLHKMAGYSKMFAPVAKQLVVKQLAAKTVDQAEAPAPAAAPPAPVAEQSATEVDPDEEQAAAILADPHARAAFLDLLADLFDDDDEDPDPEDPLEP